MTIISSVDINYKSMRCRYQSKVEEAFNPRVITTMFLTANFQYQNGKLKKQTKTLVELVGSGTYDTLHPP